MKQTRTNQGGSVVSFLVVGVVFVVIIIGAVYALQHRKSSTPSSSPIATTSKAPSPSTTTPNSSVAPAPTPSENSQNNGSENSSTNSTDGLSTTTMPQTGPSDMMPGAGVIAVLTGMIIAFVQSVRARRNLVA